MVINIRIRKCLAPSNRNGGRKCYNKVADGEIYCKKHLHLKKSKNTEIVLMNINMGRNAGAKMSGTEINGICMFMHKSSVNKKTINKLLARKRDFDKDK